MANSGALYGIIGALGVVVVGGGLYIAKQEGAFGSSATTAAVTAPPAPAPPPSRLPLQRPPPSRRSRQRPTCDLADRAARPVGLGRPSSFACWCSMPGGPSRAATTTAPTAR